MHATLEAVLARTEIASDLPAEDHELARRIAGEWTRYGVGALAKGVFEGPSGRKIARMACEDVEGVRRMASCFAERQSTIEVTEEVEEPPSEEGGEPTKRTVTRTETVTRPPRVLELADGHGMVSLVMGLAWPEIRFTIRDDDQRRRWLWQRMALSFGLRNLKFLPAHARVAPGEWDVVLIKDVAPQKAMDLAGSLLAEGGNLLLWQDRHHAKGLRRRHLDARSRPLRLAEAVAMESPAAIGRLVARIYSPMDGLDGDADEA
jgi:hypothetical protein